MTSATAEQARDIYTVPEVAAAREVLIDLEARDTALRVEGDAIWRLINPNQTSDEFTHSTASERAIARTRQDEVRRERDILRVKLDAAERAVAEAIEVARHENTIAYERRDAELCARLDSALVKVLDIVNERQALADRASALNRGRAVDAGPVTLTTDAVESWRAWRRAARRL